MPRASSRPAARRGTRTPRRSARRPGERRAGDGLNLAERELLTSFCAPGAPLLVVGDGEEPEALAAARLGYRVTALRSGEGPAPGVGRPLLRVASRSFEAAFLPVPALGGLARRRDRIALLREAARAVRSGGFVLVSVRNGLSRPGWRRALWDYAERRAELGQGWRRLDPGRSDLRCAATDTARAPSALFREAAAAGLRIATELPWPTPPPGALGAVARRGAACWHAAFEVL